MPSGPQRKYVKVYNGEAFLASAEVEKPQNLKGRREGGQSKDEAKKSGTLS